jgi:hypothetical protein
LQDVIRKYEVESKLVGNVMTLADAKKKCLKAGIDIKKRELIRIGISLVYGLGLSRLKKEKRALQPIKTGRPKKAKLV